MQSCVMGISFDVTLLLRILLSRSKKREKLTFSSLHFHIGLDNGCRIERVDITLSMYTYVQRAILYTAFYAYMKLLATASKLVEDQTLTQVPLPIF